MLLGGGEGYFYGVTRLTDVTYQFSKLEMFSNHQESP